MTTFEAILSVITLLLGGTNVVTFVQLKSLRRKGEGEADSVAIHNLQDVINLQGQEIARLSNRLQAQEDKTDECGKRCEDRITALQSKYESIINALRASGVKLPTV